MPTTGHGPAAPAEAPLDADPAVRARADDRPSTARILAYVAFALAVAAGVVLRFWTLSPLWLDEALSVNIAALPLGEIPEALRHDGHPPLYYVLLHGWMALFGTGDAAVRALSGVLSVAALPLAWAAGRRLAGGPGGLAALGLLATSPFALRYATEARMYALVVLLVLAGWLALARALERPSALRLILVGLCSGLLLVTHYWSFYLLAATLAVLAAGAFRAHRAPTPTTPDDAADATPVGAPGAGASTSSTTRPFVAVAVAVVAGGVLFLPWLPSFLAQASSTGTPWAGPVRPPSVVMISLVDFGGGPPSEAQFLGFLLALLALAGLLARPAGRFELHVDLRTVPGVRAEWAVTALTLALGVGAMYATRSAFASRYAAVVFPLFLLAAAVGVSRFASPGVRAALLAAALAPGLLGGYRNLVTDRTQAGDVVRAVNEQAAPGDVVVFCPDQLGPAASRGLRDDVTAFSYPLGTPPQRVDWRDYLARHDAADPAAVADEVTRLAGPEGSVWLVWRGGYRGLEGDCEDLHKALWADRPGLTEVLVEDAGVFEPANLSRFAPPGAPAGG